MYECVYECVWEGRGEGGGGRHVYHAYIHVIFS